MYVSINVNILDRGAEVPETVSRRVVNLKKLFAQQT